MYFVCLYLYDAEPLRVVQHALQLNGLRLGFKLQAFEGDGRARTGPRRLQEAISISIYGVHVHAPRP